MDVVTTVVVSELVKKVAEAMTVVVGSVVVVEVSEVAVLDSKIVRSTSCCVCIVSVEEPIASSDVVAANVRPGIETVEVLGPIPRQEQAEM